MATPQQKGTSNKYWSNPFFKLNKSTNHNQSKRSKLVSAGRGLKIGSAVGFTGQRPVNGDFETRFSEAQSEPKDRPTGFRRPAHSVPAYFEPPEGDPKTLI